MYYSNKDDVEKYIEMAKGYDGKDLINILVKYLNKGSSVLELGTGPGVDLKILAQYFDVTGSDYSKPFLENLAKIEPKAKILQLDAKTIDTKDRFDCIYSNKVLHHLSTDDLKQSLIRQTCVLNKEGIVAHSFWKGEGEQYYGNTRFVYYNKEDLERIFSPYYNILYMEYSKDIEGDDSIFVIAKAKIQASA